MTKILFDVELSIPQDRMVQFKELSDLVNKPVPEVIEICMYTKLEDLLQLYKENVPTEQQENKVVDKNKNNDAEVNDKDDNGRD